MMLLYAIVWNFALATIFLAQCGVYPTGLNAWLDVLQAWP
jgi:hypothetical protein